MCGISGLISRKLSPYELKIRISNMNESLIHRGPEVGNVVLINNNIALGHRRLAIIDISEKANQPMVGKDDRFVIVFNGEIYNFNEIKQELSYPFLTKSDTEVIIAAVQENGIDWLLEHANGMFAFALHDKKECKTYIARDRFGIKPLVYYQDENNFIFASEVKGLLKSGLIEAIFNNAAVDEYLANRYVRAPFTFFENIYQLIPGNYLIIDNKRNVIEKCYWELPDQFNEEDKYDESLIENEFREKLVSAVKLRLISDVPLGTYLSGGLDSSLLTAIVATEQETNINTYTIGFEESNEFSFAEKVSREYKTIHHSIVLKKLDYFNFWDKLISYKDAPLGIPNEIPLAIMSNVLKKDITVVLSGEGADELLGGYGRIFRSGFDYKNHVSNMSFQKYFLMNYEYVPRKTRDMFLVLDKPYRKYFDEKVYDLFANCDSYNEMIFRYFHSFHVQGLLQRVDMTTMYSAVEARVPFLDHSLVEYSYKIVPYDLKLKWMNQEAKGKAKKLKSEKYSEILDIPKYILKKVAYQYISKENIERRKVGFPVPLDCWLDDLIKLGRTELKDAGWLKSGCLDNLINHLQRVERGGQLLWMFINIEKFKKQYFRKDWRY